ncbi:MAG: hypothetical protein J4215_03970 [Candidatus Diapherotrites archaeon]|uniref:Lipoprotein n=1 Tax=Candidatus Iainarchaeum sp. TaxID=3101447 RepID=A0A8T4L345_9ARCH|nr:hypothetical protein [Candidatus Diapherotrites archaeon]
MNRETIFFALIFSAALLFGCVTLNDGFPRSGFGDLNAPPMYIDPVMFDPNRDPQLNAPNPNLGGLPSCDTIMSAQDREVCYRNYAKEHNQPELCEQLWEQYNDCYTGMAFSTYDRKYCDKIKYNQDYKDMCYLGMAKHAKDLSLCASIQTPSIKQQCGNDNTPPEIPTDANPNPTLPASDQCSVLSDSLLHDMCYVGMASDTKNPLLCEKIFLSENKDTCYGAIASAKQNASYCTYVQNLQKRPYCYTQVAIETNDPGVCNGIQGYPDMIDLCKDAVAQNQ